MTGRGNSRLSRRAFLASAAAAATVPVTAMAAGAATRRRPVTSAPLPDGFAPEGIAVDRRGIAYCGNRLTGAVYRIDLTTGTGSILAKSVGAPCAGLKVGPRGRLYVAGDRAGDARIIDTASGDLLATYGLVPPSAAGLVNDVVITPTAAYFTDSARAALYALPIPPDGSLPGQGQVTVLPLTGLPITPGTINLNGIVSTPDGRALIVAHSAEGTLYRVDPAAGTATLVDLGGGRLGVGDGMLRQGTTLFVVLPVTNEIAVLALDRKGRAGRIIARLTDPAFDIPTTVAAFGGRLYLPNARFDVPVTETTPYDVVSVPVTTPV
jgi:sugar lactone lactonase YvrE